MAFTPLCPKEWCFRSPAGSQVGSSLSAKEQASWWPCICAAVTWAGFLQTGPSPSGQWCSAWKGPSWRQLAASLLADKAGERDPSRPGAGTAKGKERWGLGHSHILWPYGSPGGVPGSYWELHAEGVKISKALPTGGVILTQHLCQLIWEHLACSSLIIHSIKLWRPGMIDLLTEIVWIFSDFYLHTLLTKKFQICIHSYDYQWAP